MMNWQFFWYHFGKRFSINEADGHFCGVHLTYYLQYFWLKHCIITLQLLLCVPNVRFKWVSLSIFLWTQSNLNWRKKSRLYFNDFSWQWCLKCFKYARLEWMTPLPPVSCLKIFQAIHSSFVTITKPLNNKRGEAFCKELKWMCKLFEINGQKDF